MAEVVRIRKWNLIWPFFYILFLHVAALFFFTRGFLLTRTELSSISSCSDLPDNLCSRYASLHPRNSSEKTAKSDGKCWTKPAVDRVVIIVLDALRFDFVAPSTFFKETQPWMDKLKVLQRLASDKTVSARIFKAIADPPTTSLQRLKGLTTGGLPTFVDVGNSFGTPSIAEDNILFQLTRNGKRVTMMGDDTWLQLFPDQFQTSYPFPSFNVKDLDTVDNGVIEHLFPALYNKDWDILIAHFLGVDHAGHIFRVDSPPMIEKLETYNKVIEAVVDILKNQSGPGGLHENTLLLVMGDHGQTLNGDHGGGTPEEVETSLFVMNAKKSPDSLSPYIDNTFCNFDMDGKEVCISSIQQLDFAATLAALVGVPFPYGSIGQVNSEFYALSSGAWFEAKSSSPIDDCSTSEAWLQKYVSALCINSWQVKRYIDDYSKSSLLGFAAEDLHQVAELYSIAQRNYSDILIGDLHGEESGHKCQNTDSLLGQIKLYSDFLQHVAALARSKWTQFDGKMMGLGICILVASLFFQWLAMKKAECLNFTMEGEFCFLRKSSVKELLFATATSVIISILATLCFVGLFNKQPSLASLLFSKKFEISVYFFGGMIICSAVRNLLLLQHGVASGTEDSCKDEDASISLKGIFSKFSIFQGEHTSLVAGTSASVRALLAVFLVAIHSFSLLSNSYILAEGNVANFLLVTAGLYNLRCSIIQQKMNFQAVMFLLLNFVLRVIKESSMSKHNIALSTHDMGAAITPGDAVWAFLRMLYMDVIPVLVLFTFIQLSWRNGVKSKQWTMWKLFYYITMASFMLLMMYWILESKVSIAEALHDYVGRNTIPRAVYALSFGAVLYLLILKFVGSLGTDGDAESIGIATTAMFSAWGSTILILVGRQGLMSTMLSILEGFYISRLQWINYSEEKSETQVISSYPDPLAVTQWNLLSIFLFFSLGHWCNFDGLHYGAAFVGFDEFQLIRQGTLLAIETFGVSHILPIFALPLLVKFQGMKSRPQHQILSMLSQVFLMYGLIAAVGTSVTVVSVTIQRRHLMVWGLFAPKFVFDVVGLILTDVLICIASIYYY